MGNQCSRTQVDSLEIEGRKQQDSRQKSIQSRTSLANRSKDYADGRSEFQAASESANTYDDGGFKE